MVLMRQNGAKYLGGEGKSKNRKENNSFCYIWKTLINSLEPIYNSHKIPFPRDFPVFLFVIKCLLNLSLSPTLIFLVP